MNKLYILLVTFIGGLVVNYLSVAGVLNRISTKAVSDLYINYFTPAPYVFSIWSVIYTFLILTIVILFVKKDYLKEYIEKTSNMYSLVNVLNSLWLVLWHYNQLSWSVLVMVLIFYYLLRIYKLGTNNNMNSKIIRISNSLYLGWISVALIGNISSFLTFVGFQPSFTISTSLAVVMIAIALTLGVLMVFLERNYVYYGVIAWAVIGIINRFGDINIIFLFGTAILVGSIVKVLYFLISDMKKLRDLDSN